MAQFRTELIPKVSREKIRIGNQLFLIGSCFADNIGDLLLRYKFRTALNPFGVIYNPSSIFKVMVDSLNRNELDESGLFEHHGVFRHFDFHSDISAGSREHFYRLHDQAVERTRNSLKEADWVVISFGTSIVYEHRKYMKIVANCHKVPGIEFTRRKLVPEEIIAAFDSFYKIFGKINERARIILTVSPVRHVRSTLGENSVSKAILRYTADRLATVYSRVDYFPSFEIMMDDLRDYRFYKPDMVHPNETAIEYIWSRFIDTYFDPEAAAFVREWSDIRKALAHVPFFPDSVAHQEFIRKTIKKVQTFASHIDVSEELKHLEKQLA